MTLLKWESMKMILKANFSHPLMISSGQDIDYLKVRIKAPELFMSASSGKILNDSNTNLNLKAIIPRQLPHYMKLQDL